MKVKERIVLSGITITMFVGFFISLLIIKYLIDTGVNSLILANVSVGVVSLLGLSMLALAHSLEVVTDKTSAWIFLGMIVLTYIGVICDNLSWAADGSVQYIRLNYILNVGGFLVMPFIMILFWYYQNKVFLDEFEHSNKIRLMIYIAAVIDILYIIIGAKTGYLFYIDATGGYVYGRGYVWAHVYPAIMIVCCVYENLRRKLPFEKKFSLLAYGLVPAITVVLLIPLPEYSFAYVAFFVNLILLYGTVQTKKELELAEKNVMIAEQNRALAQQKTQIMISQMQPHFLYNTLTAIYYLCDTDTALAQKMIQDFSSYLRTNMDSIQATTPIPFEKELAHTKTYLAIEQLRFSDMMNVEFNIAVTDFKLPALTLQPIVENAVKYGIRSREDGGTVTIATQRKSGRIFISVHDDGMGFDVNEKKNDGRSHLGIENTRNRLKQMMNAELCVNSQIGEGTTVTIILGDQHESFIGR